MKLENARILLTGAAGGIGRAVAVELAKQKARLLLADRDAAQLASLAQTLRQRGAFVETLAVDLTRHDERQTLVKHARQTLGGIDVLINNAGLLHFTNFEDEESVAMERLLSVNLIAPMQLTRLVLAGMRAQGAGRIVNMGSTFGSIAFPYFASYSASKFGLRGFSESLRRELAGSGVGVLYFSPRATRTSLNSDAVTQMNEALKVSMDEPAGVAASLVVALENDVSEAYLGWPEKLFVKLNGLVPRLVDGSLIKQLPVMRRFLQAA